ncbi:MAG TPA: hypothetical protein VFS59_13505, partial [Gemmatimonadaceae bacterium]|nr:hypothetical protein [Gemmatimonadaceae bacterium]
VTGAGVAYRRAGARAASARSVPAVRVPVVRVPVEPMIGPLASPPVVAPAPRPAAHVALAIAPPRSAAELADDARRQHRARAYEDAVATARRSVQIDAGQVGAWVTLVQSLANAGRLPEAGIACAAALDRHRTSSELLVLQSVLLASAGRPEEAALSARGALYLDRGSVMAWMTLGTALARLGEAARARHAFANAERLLGALAGDVEVAMADGETASGLRAIVRARLGMLDGFAA